MVCTIPFYWFDFLLYTFVILACGIIWLILVCIFLYQVQLSTSTGLSC
uniref:Uncharacterized protein n=1 Tax=Arundo donax TaxID=35708 RepID=A0A0A9HSJ3_ARUDO